MRRRFGGFYPETFEFFRNIRFNNNKPWFEAHRDDFEAYVKAPMEALVTDLEPLVARIDPSLDVRPRRVLSRIYRDARYARGVPYRDHMWLSFKPMGKTNSEALTYYFYVEEDAWGVGLGLYAPVPELQDRFRQRLFTEGEEWRRILALPQLARFTVSGDGPKRPKDVGLPADLSPWYHYRRFDFDVTWPIDTRVFTPALTDAVEAAFTDLEPVYRFITGIDTEEEE